MALALQLPTAQALVSPVSVNIFPPFELPSDTAVITGVRFSLLWGKQQSVYGLDIGVLGNVTYVGAGGTEVSGLFNVTHGKTVIVGAQAAGLNNVNTNTTSVLGVQAAAGLNFNSSETTIYGVQVALLNIGPRTDIRGVQLGLINTARSVVGLQIGLINKAASVHGLQLGFMNINDSGFVKAFPVINGGF